ncbi:aspartyl-phosphate phosphatase Spo0E family protein [Virgibacillus soli]|uniref:aspartyl-phosphate phosphatase Spo0E family protein n=1 Tax=Paracerasibacillus soli TaxID=480284 RepID=UPI0035E94B89
MKQIEQCRKEMISLGSEYELTSDVVVQSSKRLDNLLLQYQKKIVDDFKSNHYIID